MKYKKKSTLIAFTAIACTILFCIATTSIGVYAAPTNDKLNNMLINIQHQQPKTDKDNAVIEQIDYTVMDGEKAGIKVTLSNHSEADIEDIFLRIKFPNNGINVDYSTKNDSSWRLNAGEKDAFNCGLSYNNTGNFTIAIISYTTIEGVAHTVSDEDLKWTQFFYPGKDTILEHHKAEKSKEIFTTKINESLYGKQYFPISLSAGDTCTAHLSWSGNSDVYLVYVGSNDFNTDKNGDLLLNSYSKSNTEYFKYKFQNDKQTTFTVPKDGLYVLPVKDNNNGEITNLSGEFSYTVY